MVRLGERLGVVVVLWLLLLEEEECVDEYGKATLDGEQV